MRFEWDPDKARINRTKHGVEFVDAVDVLFDPLALTRADERTAEMRHVTLGTDAFGRLLVVVFSKQRDCIRIISARQATRRERDQYQEGP